MYLSDPVISIVCMCDFSGSEKEGGMTFIASYVNEINIVAKGRGQWNHKFFYCHAILVIAYSCISQVVTIVQIHIVRKINKYLIFCSVQYPHG